MTTLRDELIRTSSRDGTLSVRVVVASNLVREAAHRHQSAPAATVALGRALLGGLLLASESSPDLRVQIQFRGRGPVGPVTVTADGRGRVRGYAAHPKAVVGLEGSHLGTAAALGQGELRVERMHPAWKQPYSGIVPMVTGEVAQDLALYLLESEQKPSALALGVYLGPGGEVEAAGGYLVRALPEAPAEAMPALEDRIEANSNPSEQIRAGISAREILEKLLAEAGHGRIDQLYPRFLCDCDRERVRRAASLLGEEEIAEIVAADEELEIRCSWCAEVYRLGSNELAKNLIHG